MILEDLVSHAVITLPDRLIWADEFSYTDLVSVTGYSLSGALLVEQATKLAGRPFSFDTPDDLNWVPRADIELLITWAKIPNRTFKLTLSDTREFVVMFDTTQKSPIITAPVSELPSYRATDMFHLRSLKLLGV